MTLTLPQTALSTLPVHVLQNSMFKNFLTIKPNCYSGPESSVWDLALILNFNQFVIAVSD